MKQKAWKIALACLICFALVYLLVVVVEKVIN